MKILIAQNEYNLSGAPMCAFELAKGLKQRGYQVFTCAPTAGDMQEMYKALDIPTLADPRLFQESTFGYQLATQVDAVVCFTSLAYNFVHGVKGAGKPCIFSIHEVDQIGLNWARDNMIFRKAMHKSDYVVFPCDHHRKKFSYYLKDASKARTVYSGFEEPKNEIVPGAVSPKTKFLVVGSLEPRKNQMAVIQALGQEESVELTFIGRVLDQVYTNELVQMAGKTKNTTIMTAVNREKLSQFYSETDVVIVPSKEEVLSLIVGEAAMHKKPAIVANVGGVPENIVAGNGFVFNPNDVMELKKLALTLSEDRELRLTMGQASYDFFKANRTQKQYIDAYETLIKELA